jgi:hypothetical protein
MRTRPNRSAIFDSPFRRSVMIAGGRADSGVSVQDLDEILLIPDKKVACACECRTRATGVMLRVCRRSADGILYDTGKLASLDVSTIRKKGAEHTRSGRNQITCQHAYSSTVRVTR